MGLQGVPAPPAPPREVRGGVSDVVDGARGLDGGQSGAVVNRVDGCEELLDLTATANGERALYFLQRRETKQIMFSKNCHKNLDAIN